MLRGDPGELTEFLSFTPEESPAAVKPLAGDNYETAVF
jgi:hypothetical protein